MISNNWNNETVSRQKSLNIQQHKQERKQHFKIFIGIYSRALLPSKYDLVLISFVTLCCVSSHFMTAWSLGKLRHFVSGLGSGSQGNSIKNLGTQN